MQAILGVLFHSLGGVAAGSFLHALQQSEKMGQIINIDVVKIC